MSATASFFLIDKVQIPSLLEHSDVVIKNGLFSKKIIDHYWDFLKGNSIELY